MVDENEKLKLAAEAAQQGSPDDVIAGPDAAVGDPQIRTMAAGGPPPVAAPGNDMFRRTMQGQQGQWGEQGQQGDQHGQHGQGHHMGWGQHHGWLQQIMQRIQEARAQREQQHPQMGEQWGQQWGQSPMGQQFMASPMGQQMQQQHPGWFPQAAPAGQTPANIVVGDHTGEPGPAAMPPTAAQAAQQQAQAVTPAPAAAAAPAPAAAAQTARAPTRDQAQQPPMGVMQRAPEGGPTRMPMFGNGANDAIAQALRARNGGGMGGGSRRMF